MRSRGPLAVLSLLRLIIRLKIKIAIRGQTCHRIGIPHSGHGNIPDTSRPMLFSHGRIVELRRGKWSLDAAFI